MKRLAIFLLTTWAVVGLSAQDEGFDEEDIFAEGAFDEAVTVSQAEAETTKLSWLGGMTVLSDTSLLLPTDRAIYGGQSFLSGKGFLKADKPEVGQFFVSYAFSHTLLTSTNDSGFRTGFGQADPSLDTPKFQLSELHLSFDLGKILFVRVGNQLVSWGSSFFWSPADFVNQRPSDATAAIDTRTGKTGVRLHLPLPSGNVFVFGDFSQSLDGAGEVQDLVEKGTVAFRADTSLAGFNVGALGSFGKTAKPQAGLTLSGRLFQVDLWGEYAATLPLNDFEYAWAASVGGEKVWGDWTLRGEWFENPQGKPDTELTFSVLSGFKPFFWGQQYAFAALSKSKLWGDGLDGSVSVIGNVTDRSYTINSSLSFRPARTVPFTLSLKYYGGPEKREFTLQNGAHSLALGVRSVLEF